MNTQKVLKIIGVVAVVVLIAFLAIYFTNNSKKVSTDNSEVKGGNTAEVTDQINVRVDVKSKQSSYVADYKEGETAFELIKRIDEKYADFSFEYSNSDYGVFITSMNGYKPDSAKEFWEFKINGSSASVGVGSYTVQKNDAFEFVVTEIIY